MLHVPEGGGVHVLGNLGLGVEVTVHVGPAGVLCDLLGIVVSLEFLLHHVVAFFHFDFVLEGV